MFSEVPMGGFVTMCRCVRAQVSEVGSRRALGQIRPAAWIQMH